MKVEEYIVRDKEKDDDVLHRKGFDVNIRLYSENPYYRKLIQSIIEYFKNVRKLSFEDYSKIRGISGANVGIPLNIIVVYDSPIKTFVMINPKVIEESKKKIERYSNCGSLMLKKSIKILRPRWIKVEYFDIKGKKNHKAFFGSLGATILHEIEHNLGILITDK